jgi:hypothetical protein
MYIAKLNSSDIPRNLSYGITFSHDILEYTTNSGFSIELLEKNKNTMLNTIINHKIYKFINETENKLHLNKINLVQFKYIIGIKKTSTNLLYHATHMNGEIIVANTKSKIVTQLNTYKINSNSVTGLNQIILSLINEIKYKLTKKSPVVLHLHDFKDYESRRIIKTLSIKHKINIKAVVLTNTNPHNGCRPPKIKTKTYINFEDVPYYKIR